MVDSQTSEPRFIGREQQLSELRAILHSQKPEFVAVYGRRRVGKTFLIREAAHNNFAFWFTAAHGVLKKEQLMNFSIALKNYSGSDRLEVFNDWFQAFAALGDYIDSLPKEENKIIFFDELPWADTPKSGFLGAFENFWNSRCAFRGDLKLVVCGSATSWIINKVIHNRGGLHGRLTHTFVVEPFTLYESREYFKAYGYAFANNQIAEIYMIMGGIPYYFSLIDKGQSVARNIDRLFFSRNGVLQQEFEMLYAALFRNPQPHLNVVIELAKTGKGLTRQELLERLNIAGNGAFSLVLKELEECGFVRCYLPFEKKGAHRLKSDKSASQALYQLVDLYTLFYLRFVKENRFQDTDFWTANYHNPELNTWRGLAFERLCLWHIQQIKEALGISGVSARISSWIGKNADGRQAQIDLLIDRRDDVVNICEMKFSATEYAITGKYAEDIERKIAVFLESTATKKMPVVTFITSHGLKQNSYIDVAQKQIVLGELFRP